MLDINYLKKNLGEAIRLLAFRDIKPGQINKILLLDEKRRELIQRVDKLKQEKNEFSNSLSKLSSQERNDLIAQFTNKAKSNAQIKNNLGEIEATISRLLSELPNIPASDVKPGNDEENNEIIKSIGQVKKFSFTPKDHLQLGTSLDIIDTKTAAKVSGSRFGYLKNEAVLLEFALINLAFSILRPEGFQLVLPPVMIKDEMMSGLGYLAGQGEAETYHFENDGLFFIGTAEHALIPMEAGNIISDKELPVRLAGFSTCFRRESGSYGKDTQGILRVHQFDKIEMVSFATPDKSDQEQQFILSLSEKLVQLLELPYRVIRLCTGETSFPSARTYDIECWMPSQNKYRETGSISNCTDYQSRRLKIRYKDNQGKNSPLHTLNGTAYAIGRTLIAILENYQEKDGSVAIPTALQPFLPGIKKIYPKVKP